MTSTCIIIGAMKAGTTTLFDLLRQHPSICPSRNKEPEFFSPYGKINAQVYDELWDFDPSRHEYRMEASTGYTKINSAAVPRNIAEYGLNPRMIYILRDPFERIESHFNFMRKSLNTKWRERIDAEPLIVASDYMWHIDNYLGSFNRDQLLLVDFQRLKDEPHIVLTEILSFLDLDVSGFHPEYEKKNVTQYEMSLTEVDLRRLMHPIRWRFPKLWKAIEHNILSVIPKTGDKIKLSAMQRDAIKRRLQPGMARLAVEHGFDVEQWGFNR